VLALLIIVVSIAIVDSLNPSTIAPALYLATTYHPRRHVGGFIVGVFVVNLLAGLLIMVGPGQLLLAVIPRPSPTTKHAIEVIAGLIILSLAGILWSRRRFFARSNFPTVKKSRAGSSLALGAGIAVIELPTALPYFAAIAAITESGFNLAVRLAMLTVYNVIFVLPLIMILTALEVLGDNASRILGQANRRLQAQWPALLATFGLFVGAVILTLGIVGLSHHL
jgi:cytochrome c biogenesis protein CcdA